MKALERPIYDPVKEKQALELYQAANWLLQDPELLLVQNCKASS